MTRLGEVVSASFLGIGFAFITVVAFVVEPRMGLNEPADRFDPATVFAATEAPSSVLGNLVILGFGLALAYLAAHSDDRYFRAAGIAGAFGFFLMGCLGRIAGGLPDLISDPALRDAALVGLLSVRQGVLQTSVFSLGVAAWGSTRKRSGRAHEPVAWRGLGFLILAASVAFLFIPIPLPLMLAVWATWYAVRLARDA